MDSAYVWRVVIVLGNNSQADSEILSGKSSEVDQALSFQLTTCA